MNIKEAITIIAAIIGIIGGIFTINNYISSEQSHIPTSTASDSVSPSATTGSISVSSSPSGASIFLDENYKGTTPMTIKDADVGSHTITLKYSGYQNWSQNIYVVAGQTILISASLTPQPIPASTTGSISVSSSPSGASIFLDENYNGTTPMTIESIEAGSHTITLKYSGYQNWSQNIHVVAGQTIPILAALTPQPTPASTTGSISLSSSPSGASIFLDGNYVATTPMTIESIEAGSHTITLKYSGYQNWSQNIYVVAGQTIPISAALTLQPTPASTTGSISVSSSPSGASIFLNGNFKGTTPMTIKDVEAGSYSITLRLTGYQDWSQSISVKAGDITFISRTLDPESPKINVH